MMGVCMKDTTKNCSIIINSTCTMTLERRHFCDAEAGAYETKAEQIASSPSNCTQKIVSITTRPCSASGKNLAKVEDHCHSIRHKAWNIAYKHIYTSSEINDYFDGKSKEGRTWPSVYCDESEILACEIDGEMVGYAKWAWIAAAADAAAASATQSRAEMNSLYVDPEHWGSGIGTLLWDRIIMTCREKNIESMDVWVLGRARSGEFYASKGCRLEENGDYFIGDHVETASCYRWCSKS